MRGRLLVPFVALVLISWALPSLAVTYTCPKYDPSTRNCANIHSGKSKSDYFPGSNPMYIGADTCRITNLPTDLQATINTLFPEGRHPDPSMIRQDVFAYVTKPNTNITFTFVSTGAGYQNRLGYAKFNPTANNIIGSIYPVFPLINTNNNVGCLQKGDTYKFGRFDADDMVIFYLDANSDPGDRFWSYINKDFPNPDRSACSCQTGFVHGSWAYLSKDDITLFGFEDLKLGDADYNDVMFFLGYEGGVNFNEVPDYENGTLKICNPNTTLADKSFAVVNCTIYGILEAIGPQSCLTYMSLPAGYTWARDDDLVAREAIQSLARSQWAYTGASCFVLSTSNTTGIGYDYNLNVCPAEQWSVNWIYNATSNKWCYNTACTARFVLKGANLGTSCSSAPVCKPSTVGSVLALDPPTAGSNVQYPNSASVFLRSPDGTIQVPLSVALNTATPRKQMDLIVFVDMTAIPSGQVEQLVTDLTNFWQNMDSRLDFRLALGLTYNGVAVNMDYVFYPYSTATLAIFVDRIRTMGPGASAARCASAIGTQTKLAGILNQAISYRPDAYKGLYITSQCATTVDTAFKDAIFDKGIRSYFFTHLGSIPSGWSTGTAATPIGYANMARNVGTYQTGIGWSTIRDGLVSWTNNVFLYVASDPNGFIPTMTSSFTNLPSSGYYGTEIAVRWPSGLVTPEAVPSFAASVRFLGRNLLTVNINFNHKPVVANIGLPVNGGVRREINFNPTDPDANVLTITILSYPSTGTLSLIDGTPITTGMIPYTMAAGNYKVNFDTRKLDYGTAFFDVRVSDGCATTDARATLTITPTNTPPEALDFTITITEDSVWNNPLANGFLNFSAYVRDDDEPSQILTVSVVSLPPRLGTLRTWRTSSSGSPIGANSVIGNKRADTALARFVLNAAPSGWGTVTFTYKVNDGIADSPTATVTVNVLHINHPPVLNVPVTSFKVKATDSGPFPISATVVDQDGTSVSSETVTLRIVASNIGDYYHMNDAGAANTVSYQKSNSIPHTLYTSPWGPTPASSSNFPVRDLSWSLGSLGGNTPPVATVVIQAFDDSGAASNQVTLTFEVTPLSPPTWHVKPDPDYTINQGELISNLPYRATDVDTNQYQSLIFNLTTPIPAGHTVSLISGASVLALPTGTTFSNPTHGTYVTLSTSPAPGTSDFMIQYQPPSTFYGTFTFSFTVRDPDNLYANTPATVTIHVTRRLDPPMSSNCEIRGMQETYAQSLIGAYSQNDFANNEVLLEMVSLTFVGRVFVDSNTNSWTPGTNSSLVKAGANIKFWVLGDYGIYSPDAATPIGSFTFRPIEPSAPANGTGATYTCQIYLEHVNKPPTSSDQSHYIKKREVLHVVLPASDPDFDDPPITITAILKSISGKGNFYADQALTQEITSDFIVAGGNLTTARQFWYVSNVDVSTNGRALATYTFVVVDKQGEPSVTTYSGSIFVTYAGDVPTYGGSLSREVNQETPLTMALKESIWTEGPLGADAVVLSLPTRGVLSICDVNSVCTRYTTLPPGGVRVESSMANVIFLPQDYDWDRNFTSFQFQLTDIASSASGVFTMYIHVLHVNKRPFIEASNFLTTSESAGGVIVNESSSLALSWRAYDQDSLPSTLRTMIRVTFYTTQGFSLYSCTGSTADWLSTSTCTFDAAVPFAVRADFLKNARRTIDSYETVTASCADFTALRAKMGAVDRNCETHFKFNFVPTPDASYTPYITISLNAVDDYEVESTTISVLLVVKAVNSPPTISAPPVVLAGAGIANPFIRDTDQNSASFNNPVIVGDVDSNGNVELLTISVDADYSGNLQYPASAPCAEAPGSNGRVWYCQDRISGFNQWLGDLRFEVTSGERADLTFEINDLGHTSDYKPSANLTAVAHTTVRILPAVAAPKGNSQTLAIAVGVAAAAGLLLLGALGFFLRKAVSPPADDYFAAATTPLSAAPQSPLYQAQNTTHENALYKGM